MMDTEKIHKEKLDRAVDILREITALIQQYEALFKTLTSQEKCLSGGIVFRIRSVWADFRMVGIIADREVAREMIDSLVVFFQHPEQFKETTPPIIQSGKIKKLVN